MREDNIVVAQKKKKPAENKTAENLNIFHDQN